MFKLPQEVKDGIKDYKASLEDLTSGRVSASRFVGVRVPWGFYSHRGGAVFMSRVRIPAGAVTARQLGAIAEMARVYGNGMVHVTTRQDIQIHGIKIGDTIKVIEYLKEYDLSPRGGGGNTVRNVMACTLSGICPHEIFEVRGHAVALTEYFLRQENSYHLPRKFKVAFSGCLKDCAGGLVNDIGFFAVVKDGRRGYRVWVGGGMGRDSRVGRLLCDFLPEEDMPYCAEAVKRVFFKHGDRKNKHHNRLRFFIADRGMEAFAELYRKEFAEIKEREHLALRRVEFPRHEGGAAADVDAPAEKGDRDFQAFLRYSVRPASRPGLVNVELRIPRGDLTAEALSKLAVLEGDFTDIEFRTSPEQNLWLCGVEKKDLHRLYGNVKTILSDFLYPSTLVDIVCCKGAMTCNLGLCHSPGLAAALEKMIAENFLGRKVLEWFDIRFNGCPNACGQHPLGKISFYGMVKKVDNRPLPFYKLLLGGRKCADKTKLAEEVGVLPAKNIPVFLKEFLERAEEALKEGEDIYEFLDGRGRDIASVLLEKYAHVPSYAENKDFYIDWGKTEEFSLAGMGPGECGAGVFDIIDADLHEARVALEDAEKEGFSVVKIRRVLFLAARSLLVVKGQEPKTEEGVFSAFKEKFVDERIASCEYDGLGNIFATMTEASPEGERKETFLYARRFLDHIGELYKTMDPTFHFPKRNAAPEAPPGERRAAGSLLLDLKGTPCPINYVKTKLFLENLNIGDVVEVILDEGAPIQNVPQSLENDGQKILGIAQEGHHYRVTVKKVV